VYIYGSYRKNKIGVPFFGPSGRIMRQLHVDVSATSDTS